MRDIGISPTIRTTRLKHRLTMHEIIESLINGGLLVDLQLIGEIINRKTANINVKKTIVYTHVNGDRRSHIKRAKKTVILRYCCTLTHDDVQPRYSNITCFIFAAFDVQTSVAVNMCINCSFFHINHNYCLLPHNGSIKHFTHMQTNIRIQTSMRRQTSEKKTSNSEFKSQRTVLSIISITSGQYFQ